MMFSFISLGHHVWHFGVLRRPAGHRECDGKSDATGFNFDRRSPSLPKLSCASAGKRGVLSFLERQGCEASASLRRKQQHRKLAFVYIINCLTCFRLAGLTFASPKLFATVVTLLSPTNPVSSRMAGSVSSAGSASSAKKPRRERTSVCSFCNMVRLLLVAFPAAAAANGRASPAKWREN